MPLAHLPLYAGLGMVVAATLIPVERARDVGKQDWAVVLMGCVLLAFVAVLAQEAFNPSTDAWDGRDVPLRGLFFAVLPATTFLAFFSLRRARAAIATLYGIAAASLPTVLVLLLVIASTLATGGGN